MKRSASTPRDAVVACLIVLGVIVGYFVVAAALLMLFAAGYSLLAWALFIALLYTVFKMKKPIL